MIRTFGTFSLANTTLAPRSGPQRRLRKNAMPDQAVFAAATCVAMLMLIVSIRSLNWRRVSQVLQGILALLVAFVTWQLLQHDGVASFEQGLLLALCVLVGLVLGVIRGLAAGIRYEPREGDVICRRGALLPFCWAAAVITYVSLLTIPKLHAPSWEGFLPPALVFLAVAFGMSTLVILSRVSSLRREHELQVASAEEQEQTLAH